MWLKTLSSLYQAHILIYYEPDEQYTFDICFRKGGSNSYLITPL